MIIVDSSVLIDFLNGTENEEVAKLDTLEKAGISYWIPAVCYQEVLQGARNEKEFKQLDEYLGSQNILLSKFPMKTHLLAARTFFDCRKRGVTIRSTVDCFIAALIFEEKARLLHSDRDFEQIRRVLNFEVV